MAGECQLHMSSSLSVLLAEMKVSETCYDIAPHATDNHSPAYIISTQHHMHHTVRVSLTHLFTLY